MEVKVKKLHKDAIINNYAKEGDAGIDLTAVSKDYDKYGNVVYGTGLAFEIPSGYVGLVFPRSSINKQVLSLANAVAVIDSGYRGEVILKFKPTLKITEDKIVTWDDLFTEGYNIGDRIAQMIILPYPSITLVEAEELTETSRGEQGFGSSGK